MSQQSINIGTQPNDGTGQSIRSAFNLVNENFTDLYDNVAYITGTASTATAGFEGLLPGEVAGYIIIQVNGNPVKIPYYNV